MDEAVLNYIVEEFKRTRSRSKERLNGNAKSKRSSRKAKIELSTVLETDINLPYITADQRAKTLNNENKQSKT